MSWTDDMLDYYAHSKPNKTQLRMVFRHFENESDAVMGRAFETYVHENEYFPQIAQLRPHVEAARIIDNQGQPRPLRTDADVKAMTQDGRDDMDDTIITFEQRRGTMRPLEEIQAEIDQARATLPATWAQSEIVKR